MIKRVKYAVIVLITLLLIVSCNSNNDNEGNMTMVETLNEAIDETINETETGTPKMEDREEAFYNYETDRVTILKVKDDCMTNNELEVLIDINDKKVINDLLSAMQSEEWDEVAFENEISAEAEYYISFNNGTLIQLLSDKSYGRITNYELQSDLYVYSNGSSDYYFPGEFLERVLVEVNKAQGNITIIDIDETKYLDAMEIAAWLDWDIKPKEEGFSLNDGMVEFNFNYNSTNVLYNGYINDVLSDFPLSIDEKLLLPLTWIEDISEVKYDDDNEDTYKLDKNMSLYKNAHFTAEEFVYAIEHPDEEHSKLMMEAISLPGSMDIQIFKFDANRIINPKSILDYSDVFQDALRDFGFAEEEISHISISEYFIIEDHQDIPEDIEDLAKIWYPEIPEIEIEEWTYEDLEAIQFLEAIQSDMDLFTIEDLEKLHNRGIVDGDLMYLLKELEYQYTPEILEYSDEYIKNMLEEIYQYRIDYWKEVVKLIEEN